MVNDRSFEWLSCLLSNHLVLDVFSEDFQRLLSAFDVKRQRVSTIAEYASMEGSALIVTFPTAESRLTEMTRIWQSLLKEIDENPDIRSYIQSVVFSTWENHFLFVLD